MENVEAERDLEADKIDVGDPVDLDHAIILHQTARESAPLDDPNRGAGLHDLANALHTRYLLVGNRADLDEAIVYHRDALELRSFGHDDYSSSLHSLANTLLTRFEQAGDRADLDEPIAHNRGALELRPPGHPYRSSGINNLANALMARFDRFGDRRDLNDAVDYYQGVLKMKPIGHPSQASTLNNLGNALVTRFEQIGDRSDLDKAIENHQGALGLTPLGRPNRATYLNNLAGALSIRFQEFGSMVDFKEAIFYYQRALELRPLGHPHRSCSLMNLAKALDDRLAFRLVASPDNIDHSAAISAEANCRIVIVDLLRAAAEAKSGGSPDIRLQASLFWVEVAVDWFDPSALEAYRVSLELLETVFATGRSLESRHMRITSTRIPKTHNIAVNGAALAIDANRIETAVELLDQGRSVLLAQAGKYRTRIDELSSIDPDLAEDFRSVSQLMEKAALSPGPIGVETSSMVGSDDAVARYSQLSERWTTIVDRIRLLKGFESFLLPTPFATLRVAAAHGPVIILNISNRRSDAIILHSHNEPLLVPLPDATCEALTRMTASANAKAHSTDFEDLLRETWERLVRPVVQALRNEFKLAKGSRIGWCPTGPASHLPLHAAGIYSMRDHILPNIYISSYTSTLSALIRARQGISDGPTADPNLLVVGQAHTPDQTSLPSITLEVEHVTSILPRTTTLTASSTPVKPFSTQCNNTTGCISPVTDMSTKSTHSDPTSPFKMAQ